MSTNVVVCGAGIIGVSIAHALVRRGCKPIVVDRVGLCPAASSKAGGFLALDWNDGSPIGPLSRRSFALHAELARSLPGETEESLGYRRLSCAAVAVSGGGQMSQRKLEGVQWADVGVRGTQPMGGPDTIAQVHPKRLTEALWREASAGGAELRVGQVGGIDVDRDAAGGPAVRGVLVDGERVAASAVIVAMGPWSDAAAAWLPLPPTLGQKYHSVVLRAQRVLSQAVFFQGGGDPEVYPRPDGTVYCTGFPEPARRVAEAPDAVIVEPEAARRISDTCGALSTELADAPVIAEQACHLPVSPDGLPVIGRVPRVAGAFVATGHSCWGILNAPATAEAVAQLVLDGRSDLDLAAFDPARFLLE